MFNAVEKQQYLTNAYIYFKYGVLTKNEAVIKKAKLHFLKTEKCSQYIFRDT